MDFSRATGRLCIFFLCVKRPQWDSHLLLIGSWYIARNERHSQWTLHVVIIAAICPSCRRADWFPPMSMTVQSTFCQQRLWFCTSNPVCHVDPTSAYTHLSFNAIFCTFFYKRNKIIKVRIAFPFADLTRLITKLLMQFHGPSFTFLFHASLISSFI